MPRLPAFLDRWFPAPPPPLFDVILIETHNACTRTCWFCKFGQERQDPAAAQMSWATIERIVANLRDLDYAGRISWFWINEPLMDPRIADIVRLTRQACPRAFLSLITNGDLLSDEVYRDLRHAGLDALGVSIYDTPAAERAEKLSADERLVLTDLRKRPPAEWENRGGNIKRHDRVFQPQDWQRHGCERPFHMMTVNTKGQAVLCCSDLYSDMVMGDVTRERLETIWHNAAFQRHRQALRRRGRKGLPLCGDCTYDGMKSREHYPLRATPPDGTPAATSR